MKKICLWICIALANPLFAKDFSPAKGRVQPSSLLHYYDNSEDDILTEIFSRLNRREGVFIDYGILPSQFLSEEGWQGKIIDPNTHPFSLTTLNPKQGEVDLLSLNIETNDEVYLEALKSRSKIIRLYYPLKWNPNFCRKLSKEINKANLQQPFSVLIETAVRHGYKAICLSHFLYLVRSDFFESFKKIENDHLTLWYDAWHTFEDIQEKFYAFRSKIPKISLIEGPKYAEVGQGRQFVFIKEPIDVVIPCAVKDLPLLELCLKGIKNFCINIRRIIVISDEPLTKNAEWFDENAFPFTKSEIALHLCKGDSLAASIYLDKDNSRFGWYYQQILKLYAPFVIPNISSNVLIVDADTIFLNPVIFTNDVGAGLFNPGVNIHKPYIVHGKKLIPHFKRQFPQYTGISHHILLQRSILEDLFKTVEEIHEKKFWEAFYDSVDPKFLNWSGASEYELYFNFAFEHSNLIEIRHLKRKDISQVKNLKKYAAEGYDYVNNHSYRRE